VALVHAALDGRGNEIHSYHIRAAVAFVEFLYASRFPVFSEHGMTPGAEVDEKILKRVQEAGATGIPFREIRRGLQRISQKEFEDHMRSLLQGIEPPLRSQEIGRKVWVWTTYTEKYNTGEKAS